MRNLLSMAPNVAALVSILGAIFAAGAALVGWSFGAGAHQERDKRVETEIAELREQVSKLSAPSGLAAKCVELADITAKSSSPFDRQQAREASSDLACHRINP